MSESNSSLFEEKKVDKEKWNPFNTIFPTEITTTTTTTTTPQNNNSIFPTDYSFPPSPSNNNTWSSNFFNDIASVPMLPEISESPFYREQRSMSYSFGHSNNNNQLFNCSNNLSTIMQEDEEEEEEEEDLYYKRTRSKSSAAIMDIWNPSNHVETDIEDAKWNVAQYNNIKRSLLTPPIQQQQQQQQRRSSLAPPSLIESNYYNISFLNQRRHSLAGPTSSLTHNIPTTTTTTTTINSILELESLSIRKPRQLIDDSLIMKFDDMGKGTRLDSLNDTIFYVVEFKGGRSDLYFSNEYFKKNDLVIVEGDRGRDLGKISKENITRNQLEIYYNRLKKNINYDQQDMQQQQQQQQQKYQSNEIYIKNIFRIAENDEITLLMAKGQDETKALMVCQSKIKQKKLNMQVVDAEYQWDRRKLTFYFVAEKRVDFRELVRELFKLYKTRIWMCAVNAITVL